MVFSELMFADESKVVHPPKPQSILSIPLQPQKNQVTELLIKAVVGHRSSTQDHVFEITHVLPKFSAFVPCKSRDLPVNTFCYLL